MRSSRRWFAGFPFVALACGSGGAGSIGGSDAGDATAGSAGSAGSSGSGGASGSGGSAATGGAGGASATGGSAGSPLDAANDAPPPADGPFECGSETCTPLEYCINPCCGGAAPQCLPKLDGGECPPGFHDGCSYDPGGQCASGGCCEQDACTPPPPYCADAPEIGCMMQGRQCIMQCA